MLAGRDGVGGGTEFRVLSLFRFYGRRIVIVVYAVCCVLQYTHEMILYTRFGGTRLSGEG